MNKVTPPALIATIPVGATTMCFYVFFNEIIPEKWFYGSCFSCEKIFREVFLQGPKVGYSF